MMKFFSSVDFFEKKSKNFSEFLFQYSNKFEREVPMDFDLNQPTERKLWKLFVIQSL